MPRTAIASLPAESANTPVAAPVTFTAADVANGNKVTNTGKQELLVRNVNADSPPVSHVFTLTAKNGGTAEYTVDAGAMIRIPPTTTAGFKQDSDSSLWMNGDSAELEIAIIDQP